MAEDIYNKKEDDIWEQYYEPIPTTMQKSPEEFGKLVKAFLDDEITKEHFEEFQGFFSKHTALSFLNDKNLSLMFQLFNIALSDHVMFNEDMNYKDYFKLNQLRIAFLGFLLRARGTALSTLNNERILQGKTIYESVMTSNQPQSIRTPRRGFLNFLFG